MIIYEREEPLRLLIVDGIEQIRVGVHLMRAAQLLGFTVKIADANEVFAVSWLTRQFNWRIRGHRPPKLEEFSQSVIDKCHEFQPHCLLSIGFAPIEDSALRVIRQMGVWCVNYLTDDAWNPTQRSQWFFESLIAYHWVFSPRRANLADLKELGCKQVSYLPFAYAPTIHFPVTLTEKEAKHFNCDVMFYGGADKDRLPYIEALIDANIDIHLYGGYWERYVATRQYARGQADSETLRKAVAGAKVTLCLVRRVNRDGHVMRSFEVPAMGACMLTEDTAEHREILGEHGQAVVYFQTPGEMVEQLSLLLRQDDKRKHLADRAYTHIVEGRNQYQDRLTTMLEQGINFDMTTKGDQDDR